MLDKPEREQEVQLTIDRCRSVSRGYKSHG